MTLAASPLALGANPCRVDNTTAASVRAMRRWFADGRWLRVPGGPGEMKMRAA